MSCQINCADEFTLESLTPKALRERKMAKEGNIVIIIFPTHKLHLTQPEPFKA